MRAVRRRGDAGETLIEVMMSVMIMSVAVVALVGALVTSVIMSDVHRKQAKAGAFVRSFAEAVQNAVAGSPSAFYVVCDGTAAATYQSKYTIGVTDFSAEVTAVKYWTGSSFSTTCSADAGVQQLTLRVSSTDGRAAESLNVIIRKPCRSTADFPLDAPCA